MRISDWSSDVCSSDLDDLLDEIETALITADVGVTATTGLVEHLRKRMKAREFDDARALLAALRSELVALLDPVAKPLEIDSAARPFVILPVGVKGAGKTTTNGKLARSYKDAGRGRSDARRGAKEHRRTCRSRWSMALQNNKQQ